MTLDPADVFLYVLCKEYKDMACISCLSIDSEYIIPALSITRRISCSARLPLSSTVEDKIKAFLDSSYTAVKSELADKEPDGKET